jgi:hypothetical protein
MQAEGLAVAAVNRRKLKDYFLMDLIPTVLTKDLHVHSLTTSDLNWLH